VYLPPGCESIHAVAAVLELTSIGKPMFAQTSRKHGLA
jgi:hypothetical protein